jgi:hypothetical protein
MLAIGFYTQSRFGAWWLMNHGGSPTPKDNDFQFQDEREYQLQDGSQYEFQFNSF